MLAAAISHTGRPMIQSPTIRSLAQALRDAAQCAVTLVALLAGVGLIAWAAGIASLADLPWALAGVFAGSFVSALIRRDTKRARRRT